MNKPSFDLPRSFDPAEFLPSRMLPHADAARWLVSTVLRKTAAHDTDLWGTVRLDSMILRRVMGNLSGGIARALVAGGALETASYRAGVRCRGYRLACRYLGDRCARVPCMDQWLRDRLTREAERMEAKAEVARRLWLPVHHALNDEQRALTIDATAADAILDGLDALPKHARLCQDVLVGNLKRRDFRFSVSSTGRVFNSLTGLKRELRSALRLAGEPMGAVDIACCQPALLAVEMLHETPANGPKGRATYKSTPRTLPTEPCPAPCPALSRSLGDSPFFRLALDGRLYEFLVDRTGLTRDAVKLGVVRDVLAKRGRYPSPVENVFRREFPAVYSFVRRVNRDDHAELIRRLQRRESWLVVEHVSPRLVGRVRCVTLHDAIFSRAVNVDSVLGAFDAVFAALGFRLSLKSER
jgi:hypothetical protein